MYRKTPEELRNVPVTCKSSICFSEISALIFLLHLHTNTNMSASVIFFIFRPHRRTYTYMRHIVTDGWSVCWSVCQIHQTPIGGRE